MDVKKADTPRVRISGLIVLTSTLSRLIVGALKRECKRYLGRWARVNVYGMNYFKPAKYAPQKHQSIAPEYIN